ncbi:hypothetical protein OE749_11175 [Aestuariibacter sp. AA17]|uniref:Lipoprotein n=1 Tax=Fluctibacter corallii TaxID=2984329 RepID=A0ABT3A997_9ALTE|nr:hypothetical protein [Aestuariibacter sp. AA17]MCV2885254.1 hypothetical protein [Aestuariibacter sp. AA17]
MNAKHTLLALSGAFSLLFVQGCASQQRPCEEILEVKRQQQECAKLKKVMQQKDYPQQALTAQKRFEEACLNLRYHRDEYDTICKGDQKPIGAPKPKKQDQ